MRGLWLVLKGAAMPRAPRLQALAGAKSIATALFGLAVVLGATGCGLANDAGNAFQAPLVGLKASDTVVETNIQTAVQAGAMPGGLSGASAGTPITNGPSTGYNEISAASIPGGPKVYAGWNQLSKDCLGEIEITIAGAVVLGETQPGTYYFWTSGAPYTACDASTIVAETTVPKGWPAGDPSSTGWPSV